METELAAIPDDALADALRRLPARTLAAARCVCKSWRGVVDGRGLLLPHLLPHSVRGIFINYIDHHRPHLFARPSSSAATASPEIDAMLGFLPSNDRDWCSIMDHCDGLLICDIKWGSQICVCNPATRRWTLLPPRAEGLRGYAGAHLMFDPAVSPHYEVVLIPAVPKKPSRPYDWKAKKKQQQEMDGPFCLLSLFTSPDDTLLPEDQEVEEFQHVDEDEDKEPDDPHRLMEWPPSPLQLNVFSSRTEQWEARSFIREGEPVGTVEEMRLDPLERLVYGMRRRCAVYQNGALYVHCRGSFIIRLSLSSDKYQVINTPANIGNAKPYLGRSGKEVCFGFIDEGQLQVWILKESYGKIEWVMRYQHDVHCYARYASLYNNGILMAGPWVIKEHNNSVRNSNHTAETLSKEGFEWDSDNDDTISVNVGGEDNYCEDFFYILGFHPYKKVVFLGKPFGAVAYHMDTSKAQYLGNSRPNCYYHGHSNGIYESFVYTPCMIGELQEGNTDRSTS
ncbi:unnamed protein product [Urochloa decumbens]|uniref:F-box domain-containing protein n=1 Tax=Urochloa decumbens TaxID=240449 RepID=A0ABC9F5M1_9POAL